MQVSEILWPTNLDFSPHEDPGMKLTEPLVTISLGSAIEPVKLCTYICTYFMHVYIVHTHLVAYKLHTCNMCVCMYLAS